MLITYTGGPLEVHAVVTVQAVPYTASCDAVGGCTYTYDTAATPRMAEIPSGPDGKLGWSAGELMLLTWVAGSYAQYAGTPPLLVIP